MPVRIGCGRWPRCSSAGEDWPSKQKRLRRCWPHGRMRLWRGCWGSLPLVAHAGFVGEPAVGKEREQQILSTTRLCRFGWDDEMFRNWLGSARQF